MINPSTMSVVITVVVAVVIIVPAIAWLWGHWSARGKIHGTNRAMQDINKDQEDG